MVLCQLIIPKISVYGLKKAANIVVTGQTNGSGTDVVKTRWLWCRLWFLTIQKCLVHVASAWRNFRLTVSITSCKPDNNECLTPLDWGFFFTTEFCLQMKIFPLLIVVRFVGSLFAAAENKGM